MKPEKIATVAFDKLTPLHNLNPRTRGLQTEEAIEKELYNPSLLTSLLEMGILERFKVEKDYPSVGQYGILQGNTRHCTLSRAMANGQTNGQFATIPCYVFEGLTDDERLNIMNDQSHRGLRRAQVFSAYAELKLLGSRPSIDIVSQLRPQIDSAWGQPKGKHADKLNDPSQKVVREAYFANRRGLAANWDRVLQCPDVVKLTYLSKLEGGSESPTDSEIKDFHSAFQADQKDDVTVTPANPHGPKFTEMWNKFTAAREAATNSGAAQKATSMMGRNAMETSIKAQDFRLGKCLGMAYLQNGAWTHEDIPALDKIGVLYQDGKTAEANDCLKVLTDARAPKAK